MKFATKIKVLIVLAICAAVTLIAGCSIGEKTWDRFLKEKNAYDKCVTYSASGGTFNDKSSILLLNLYYQEENEVIFDFAANKDLSIERPGYVFNGWVYAELDENGNPKYDEKKEYFIPSSNPVDTSKPLKLTAGQHLYVCAVWVLDVRVDVILVIDGDTDKTKEITGADGQKYKTGDVIDSKNFLNGSVSINSGTSSKSSTDYTFLQYYKDADCNEVMSGTITRPTDGRNENPKVYAKYIEGVWTVVRTDSQAADMISDPVDGAKYYLYTDDGKGVIDCKSKAFSLKTYSDDTFVTNCTIAGNGVTLKNLSFNVKNVGNGQICSVFGVFGSKADISNLTIENLTVTLTANGNLTAYLINAGVEEGAKFNNVTVKDATLTVTARGTIQNIQKIDDVYDTSNWICGGGLQSITVSGAKLTINKEEVVK